ncbi:cathepsin G-like [Otolemur garnettii]|uniref:cathepsin G-like n=1 Tax=Otolemur garnettii TaxID=30611 RepID=UPI0006442429|nr:cathepsin G-like [Otolemur garnettii]
MQPLLLPLLLAFFLPSRAETGEIIGGHEAEPHSRPYMAYLQFYQGKPKFCGGFLIRKDFVLTAAHCRGSSMNVTLGAHNIRRREETQQVIRVRRAIPHPDFDPNTLANDIMLLEGDSGGPLVCDDVAQGIVSHGKRNGKPPQVFTRVASFLPWIHETMRSFQLQEAD